MTENTILIVEDNRDILDIIRALLEQSGFNVITAETCSSAYEQMELHQPDALLTDLLLPEMTGLEFIRLVRRIAEFENMPIIAMTAYDHTYLAAAIMAGADATMRKPEGLEDLAPTISKLLRDTKSRKMAGTL